MISKTVEFYILEDYSDIYVPRVEVEYFDAYEDAAAHVKDTDETGRLKYATCIIARKMIKLGMQIPEIFDRWIFENGELVSTNHCRKESEFKEWNRKNKMIFINEVERKVVIKSEENNSREEFTLDEIKEMSDSQFASLLTRIHTDGYFIGYNEGKYQND